VILFAQSYITEIVIVGAEFVESVCYYYQLNLATTLAAWNQRIGLLRYTNLSMYNVNS